MSWVFSLPLNKNEGRDSPELRSTPAGSRDVVMGQMQAQNSVLEAKASSVDHRGALCQEVEPRASPFQA